MKILLSLIIAILTTACSTAKLETPKKYDIYLYDVCRPVVLVYVDFLKKQRHYQSHKVLSLNKDDADISYTSYIYQEDLLKATYKFFGNQTDIKLNSNVLKIRGTDKCAF